MTVTVNGDITDDDTASAPGGEATEARAAPLSAFSEITVDMFRGRGQTVMHSWEWLQSAVDIYAPDGRADMYFAGSKDQPLALAPMYRTAGLSRRLRLVGSIDTGETIDVMHADGAAVRALVKALLAVSRPLDFGHFPIGSPLTACLRDLAKGRGVVVMRRLPMRAMPFIVLDESWAEPDKAIGAKRRGKINRKRRRAAEIGEVKTRIVNPSPDEVEALLDQFIAVEAKSWKGKARTALAYDPKQTAFMRRFCAMAADRGMLRFCFLDIGENAVAAQVATVFDGRFWSIKIGYDEGFSKVSPGELLLLDLIKYAVEQKLTHFEFCGKEAEWTRRWTPLAHEITALRYYPYNLFGVLAVAGDACALIWNRVKSAWRNKSFSAPQRV